MDDVDVVRTLPLWRGRVEIVPLGGGMTNRNFVVLDGGSKYVVRLGGDIVVHGVMRFNEHAASLAAACADISPAVRHRGPGVLVIDYIEGVTLTADDVRRGWARCVELVGRAHREVARHLRGPVLAFNVFHIVRDYAATLHEAGSRHKADVPRLMAAAERLEAAAGGERTVFGHNDLLAGNFIDDGTRLWLIDWDYAGFNTPLFDLGGLASNNGFSASEEVAMLTAYFDAVPDGGRRRRFAAVKCASLLREAMWSMVSELHSGIDFDYAAYTTENLARFEAAFAVHGEFAP